VVFLSILESPTPTIKIEDSQLDISCWVSKYFHFKKTQQKHEI